LKKEGNVAGGKLGEGVGEDYGSEKDLDVRVDERWCLVLDSTGGGVAQRGRGNYRRLELGVCMVARPMVAHAKVQTSAEEARCCQTERLGRLAASG
jgi:hypothetical protein